MMRRPIRRALLLASMLTSAAACAKDMSEVVVYPGYVAGDRMVVEGRVIEARGDRAEAPKDSWWRNLRRTLRRLVNDEQEGVTVTLSVGGQRWSAVSDEEGYIRLETPMPAGLPRGWSTVEAGMANGVPGRNSLLHVPADNSHGLISDIDDTILVSDVNDKSRLLRRSLLLNYTQRKVVPGVVEFYRQLAHANPAPDSAPIFYLSASPRQLQTGIQTFLDANQFPRGVLLTKRITGENHDSLTDQYGYKLAAIERLLSALPTVSFTLIGDDGEQDPEVYDEIRRRHPDRIEAVWIRRVSPEAGRKVYPGQGDLAQAIRAAGVAAAR